MSTKRKTQSFSLLASQFFFFLNESGPLQQNVPEHNSHYILTKLTITIKKNTDSARIDEPCGCGKHVALIQKSEVKLHTGLNALRKMLQHLYDNHKFSLLVPSCFLSSILSAKYTCVHLYTDVSEGVKAWQSHGQACNGVLHG